MSSIFRTVFYHFSINQHVNVMPTHTALVMPHNASYCLDKGKKSVYTFRACQESTHLHVLFIAIACLQTRRCAVAAQLQSPGSLAA